MAIKKIFPIADTTLYSNAPSTNAGLDEMLEIGTFNDKSGRTANSAVLSELNIDDIRRTLIQFDTDDIKNTLTAASQSIVTRDALYNNTSSINVVQVNFSGSQFITNGVTASFYGTYIGVDGTGSATYSYSPGQIISGTVVAHNYNYNTITTVGFSGSYLSESIIKNTSSFTTETRLRMFLATADNLTSTYTVEVDPVSQLWSNGLGKYSDAPTNTEGASWNYKSSKLVGNKWIPSNISVTQSFKTQGGGSWYTGYMATQSFNFASDKDLNLNVTNIITAWTTGSSNALYKPNFGFIVKFPFFSNYVNTASLGSELIYESNPKSYSGIKFYSMNTHTIYPPCLEIKWNDYSFRTGSSYVTASDDSYVVLCNNNLGRYQGDTSYRFNFRARDRYPVREFSTSSVYLDWKYLPQDTCFAIQDYKTKEMAYDFDSTYTKLSVDENGSYFTLDMDGLQPERSYKVLIKSTLQTGETIIKDEDIIFKVIR